ncbi:YolD-like family protein [Bacillus sp. FJAT-47783]|uniref:YolD-like family protein n=1 Tax=Bacillus sp. FJAT-47783 TaxID=2922712 RepID=UPI001FADC507|nr:YolD-like family protein [Bacillus sp. FJAT-47783]
MIRDRGTIKWTAMMLPEHVKILRDWMKEDGYEEKPELDEQKLEQFNELIYQSLKQRCELQFTYYAERTFHSVRGRVVNITPIHRTIRIEQKEKGERELKIDSIVDIVYPTLNGQ